jgi:hypothetical protein
MKRVGRFPASFDDAEYPGAARSGCVHALEDESAGSLGHDETVAILGKRPRCRIRGIVACGEGGQQRKTN